jgi:methylenetetrahydrofolate reductase (NADPH)
VNGRWTAPSHASEEKNSTLGDCCAVGQPGLGRLRVMDRTAVEWRLGDERSIEAAGRTLPCSMLTFIPDFARGQIDQFLAAAGRLRQLGLIPVPHLAARNIKGEAELNWLLTNLRYKASVVRALIIAGDRDQPAGPYHSSLQLLQSGLLRKRGIEALYLAAYPAGHPRIPPGALTNAINSNQI